jgi:hypothetical protein
MARPCVSLAEPQQSRRTTLREGSRDPAPWQAASGQTLGRGSRSGQTRDIRTKHVTIFGLELWTPPTGGDNAATQHPTHEIQSYEPGKVRLVPRKAGFRCPLP